MKLNIDELINAITACLDDDCSKENCGLYGEECNCQFHLMDCMLEHLGISQEDYLAWLTAKVKEEKNFWKDK